MMLVEFERKLSPHFSTVNFDTMHPLSDVYKILMEEHPHSGCSFDITWNKALAAGC